MALPTFENSFLNAVVLVIVGSYVLVNYFFGSFVDFVNLQIDLLTDNRNRVTVVKAAIFIVGFGLISYIVLMSLYVMALMVFAFGDL